MQPDDLMSGEEVANLLRVHPRSLHRWLAAGKMPPPLTNLGRQNLWRRDVIDRWILAGTPSAKIFEQSEKQRR